MKYLFLSLFAILLIGCVNVYQKPAALGNRSVITMQSTEGENATVSRADSTDSVAADKTNTAQTDTAVSGTGNVTKNDQAKTAENIKDEDDNKSKAEKSNIDVSEEPTTEADGEADNKTTDPIKTE